MNGVLMCDDRNSSDRVPGALILKDGNVDQNVTRAPGEAVYIKHLCYFLNRVADG